MCRKFIRVLSVLAVTWATLAFAGEPGRYEIDSGASWIQVYVYKAGLLSGLGHNHVVSSGNIDGHLQFAEDTRNSKAQFSFDVAELVVDDARLRREAGTEFDGQVSDKDKTATRKNMLGSKLLDAARYPSITIDVHSLSELEDAWVAQVSVVVKETEFQMSLPAHIVSQNDAIEISGEFELSHAEIGLKPFSAALGTLKVHPVLRIRYRLLAQVASVHFP